MSDDRDSKTTKTNTTRRKALKAIGVSGVLAGTIPGSWSKPVVESIVLPAHAQTTQNPCGIPPCNTPGMGVSILTAAVTGGGDLIVVGDIQIPGYFAATSCYPGTTITDSNDISMATTSVRCDVVDNGSIIGTRDDGGSVGFDCSAGAGCLVSCSVLVSSANNTLSSGDCVTLRLTFNGTCVCSGITTVT